MTRSSIKTVMLEHSKAKVELYSRYLARYLNILGQTSGVNRIYIFDLFCGEGIYEDNSKGSPIVALDVIDYFHFLSDGKCPNIELWLNDNGESEIERGISKAERVHRIISSRHIASSVKILCTQEDYKHIYVRALDTIRRSQKAEGLFFIDPYGYKEVQPSHIKDILVCDNTEVILFVPASHMYRFAETTSRVVHAGSAPLSQFINTLFQGNNVHFRSVHDFIAAHL